jgi:hypothetical protein
VLGILGVGNTLVDIPGFTLLQRSAPAAVRSRVFGVLEALFAATIGLGAIVARCSSRCSGSVLPSSSRGSSCRC